MPTLQTSLPATTLSIGGATYDLFLTMTDDAVKQEHGILLKAGGKLRVGSVIETCGGGACNTSVGFARLGLSASFCGVVGSDQWGENLLKGMAKEGVNTAPATVVEQETSSFSIILSLKSGERTILYTPGVNEHLHDTTFDLDAIVNANAVYVNHLSETSCMIEDDIMTMVAQYPHINLTWNPGGCQIEHGYDHPDKKRLLGITNVLLVNKEEAMAFAKTDTVEKAMKILSSCGVRHVCITDGKQGVIATDGKKTWHCPVLSNVHVVDTTGAGDAFGTAVTWALLIGHTLPDALIAGTLNAASVVGKIGAQAGLLTETQITTQMTSSPLSVSEIS